MPSRSATSPPRWSKGGSWLSGFFRGNPKQRRAEAEATLALIDGVLLMRQLAGAQAADRAAKALGMV